MGGPERRKDPRAPVWLAARYHLVEEAPDLWYMGTITDLSAGGLRMAGDRRLEPGAKLDLEIALAHRPEPVRLKGEVVWVRSLASGSEYGVMFIELSPDQQVELDELVQFLIQKRTQS